MHRTKIVCTIGPASEKPAVLKRLARSGMNVARLNFSHGSHAGHAAVIKSIRTIAHALGEPVAILGDLQGPKIRLGILPEQGIELKTGSSVVFSTAIGMYKNGPIPVTYKQLHRDVKKGERILIDDGLLEVIITRVAGKTITGQVVNGGIVTSHKGMNFPDSTLRVSPITKKDIEDLAFGVKQGVDWMALSFVTRAEDVLALRRLMAKHLRTGQIAPRIIVKIEKHEAIDHFLDILAIADGIMIARGDLGVEIPAEQVPVRQKEIIEACRLAGKPVVVATQMLDSMIRNPRPTRAEVSDVGHAVFDHTDAVMLSGETASGSYPVQAVDMMRRIIEEAEASAFDDVGDQFEHMTTMEGSIAHAVKAFAEGGHIHGILSSVALAPWSETLLMGHPEIPLFLAAPTETLARQTNLRWGLRPFVMKSTSPSAFAKTALAVLKRKNWVKKGMRLAVVFDGKHGVMIEVVEWS